MVNRLPSWIFISLALILMGIAMLPIMRIAFGIDETIQIQYFTAIMFLIGGVMCGLTGMLLLTKRQPTLNHHRVDDDAGERITKNSSDKIHSSRQAALIHGTGLLIFTGIPLANFLACYFIWIRTRSLSSQLDTHGREAICQQVTLYLYLLVSLFMALLLVGAFAVIALLLLHFGMTVIAIVKATNGSVFRYPGNIAIIDRNIAQ